MQNIKATAQTPPLSPIAIFEPSKYQQKYGALLQQNDSLITLVPAALGKVPDSGYAVFESSPKLQLITANMDMAVFPRQMIALSTVSIWFPFVTSRMDCSK